MIINDNTGVVCVPVCSVYVRRERDDAFDAACCGACLGCLMAVCCCGLCMHPMMYWLPQTRAHLVHIDTVTHTLSSSHRSLCTLPPIKSETLDMVLPRIQFSVGCNPKARVPSLPFPSLAPPLPAPLLPFEVGPLKTS